MSNHNLFTLSADGAVVGAAVLMPRKSFDSLMVTVVEGFTEFFL